MSWEIFHENDAFHGSRALRERILATSPAFDPPTRQLTFEQQLALVSAGKASIVTMPVQSRLTHDFTLGGVSSGWAS